MLKKDAISIRLFRRFMPGEQQIVHMREYDLPVGIHPDHFQTPPHGCWTQHDYLH
jgi:hypothetical protein